MLPANTARLRFREMTPADLELMSGLLGDPEVMTYYPAPKTREESASWIQWNQDNYATYGHGLWIVETHDGEFVGDCGLTWQKVNGRPELEVGYHTRTPLQGRGYATEAATACKDLACNDLQADTLVAIIHPQNTASRRVAEKLGMLPIDEDFGGNIPVRTVMGMPLRA
ncbi:GNAT family N-acetyltransferase [Arthrobacter sp. 7Tela_A1]|uniref:GNAT family N-acetyltransferase n=1 Tax=Arthrobacter sp. 7Tela_A1 TaxID=3093745 RepID=UPI003BB4B963